MARLLALVPGTTEYQVELPLLQQSVTLTAAVATPGDTLTIAGTAVASGTPSAPIALSLGENSVDIVVENGTGGRRTYRLTLRRLPRSRSTRTPSLPTRPQRHLRLQRGTLRRHPRGRRLPGGQRGHWRGRQPGQ